MAEFSMLEHVKASLGITDEFHDATLNAYIEDVRGYLQDAGIPEAVTNSRACGGVVARGVSDLWNYDGGGTSLSPYFRERAAQLALKWGVSNGQT